MTRSRCAGPRSSVWSPPGLLTYEVSGHTAYTLGHNCIDDPVTAYLVDLTVPAQDLRCPQELA